MSPQPQERQSIRPSERKTLQELRFIIASIAILFLVSGAALWIVNSVGFIQGSWSNTLLIIFTVLGVLIGLFQWLFPVVSTTQQQPTIAPPTLPAPQIIVQVPQTTSSPPQASNVEKVTYLGIVGEPPPTDLRTIQQRQQTVQDIYTQLTQPEVTAIVLTGIAGVGKSTLAALVYRYAEDQRRTGRGPFPGAALWLNVDPSVTMTDLVGNLFEALGKPLPDFSNLSLQNQAHTLFSALNTAEQARLIIFDQFENLLDWQTGHALVDRPGVGEWIDAINNQPCRCRMLLTTRLWPQGTREHPATYMQEYFVRGMQVDEGIGLLRKLGVEASEYANQQAIQAAHVKAAQYYLCLFVEPQAPQIVKHTLA